MPVYLFAVFALLFSSPAGAETPTVSPASSLSSSASLDDWRITGGQWNREGESVQGAGDLDNRLVLKRSAPAEFDWPVTLDLKEGWSAGAMVWATEDGKKGYTVRLDSRQGKLALDRVGPWPEAEELASFPWKPTDGSRIALRIEVGAGNLRVYWPEQSEYAVLEALKVEPAGNHVGFQVIDGRAEFVGEQFQPTQGTPVTAHVPRAGEYQHVYDPSVAGAGSWYINDHCFIDGPAGWHLYGITGTKPANPWEEINFAHAVSDTLPGNTSTWEKRPYALSVDPAAGERHLWAPHIIKRGDTWYMFYCAGSLEGDSHYRIHLATSKDLNTWTRHPDNPLFKDTFHARDPMVLEDNGTYYMYYTANMGRGESHHTVHLRTSRDLISWSPASVAFVHPARGTGAGPTESPYVVRYGDHFYLFIGPDGDYHRTAVFRSPNPLHWEPGSRVCTVASHAAEVIRDGKGDWYVSDCGWDVDGVYLAPLTWVPGNLPESVSSAR